MSDSATAEIEVSKETRKRNKITQEFSIGTLFLFALPSILLQLWIQIYTMVTGAFVSVYVSTDALAAVNMAYPILSIAEAVGGCIATGASVIIAKKLGEGETKSAQSALTTATLWVLVIALAWGWGVWLAGDAAFNMLGADETLLPLLHEYYDVYVWFIVFYALQTTLQILMITVGKPTQGLIVTVLTGIANVAITWICVAPLQMGIVGMSLGEGFNALLATVACAVLMLNKKDVLHFGRPTVDFRLLVHSIYTGAGTLVESVALAVMTAMFNIGAITYFGTDGEAAGAILLYAQCIFCAAYWGMNMGVSPVIAYRYGHLNIFKFQDIVKKFFKLYAIIMVVSGVLSLFMAEPVMMLYGQPEGTPVYDITMSAWMIFSLQYIFAGVNYLTQSLFAGCQDGLRSGIASALHGLVFPILFLAVLPPMVGGVGVWAALTVSEIVAFFISIGMILQANGKYHYLKSKDPEVDRKIQEENDRKIAELKAQGIDIEEQALAAAEDME